MLEYFAYKKIKKHQVEKRAEAQAQSPLLTEEDEYFLTRIVSEEGTPPPLPERPRSAEPESENAILDSAQVVSQQGEATVSKDKGQGKGKGKGKELEKGQDATNPPKRFSFFGRGRHKDKTSSNDLVVTPGEASNEKEDINKVLDDLNLAAINNRAFSISKESQELVQKFTIILKDLVNGVPTAYDDLVHLLNDSQGTLSKQYNSLPSFLQKLIAQLPNNLSSNLAPELLAVAAEAQALSGNSTKSSGKSFAGAAKAFLTPSSLKDLIAKPGAIASLLKTIMNALKLRWPAFMGTNVLLSLGLFVLLFVFWYCHKRGRETRLEREKMVDGDGQIVEVEDDPMLVAAEPDRNRSRSRDANQSEHVLGSDSTVADSNNFLRAENATTSSERRRQENRQYASSNSGR